MTICALLGEGECRTLSVLHLPGHLFLYSSLLEYTVPWGHVVLARVGRGLVQHGSVDFKSRP